MHRACPALGVEYGLGVQRIGPQGPLTPNLFSKPIISGKCGTGDALEKRGAFPLSSQRAGGMFYNFPSLTTELLAITASQPGTLLSSSLAIHDRDDHRFNSGTVNSEIQGSVELLLSRKEICDFLWEFSIQVGSCGV